LTGIFGCKTAPTASSSLEDTSKPSATNADIFTCYNIMKVETQSQVAVATKIKENAKKVCITNKPTTISIAGDSGNELIKWNFTGTEPLRCPNYFQFTGGREYFGTISATAAPCTISFSLNFH
jgi:hypothetical protein